MMSSRGSLSGRVVGRMALLVMAVAVVMAGCDAKGDSSPAVDTFEGSSVGAGKGIGGDSVADEPGASDTGARGDTAMEIDVDEQGAIDRWLKESADSLNEYGDPVGTVYAGGTPLFDEASGEQIDKYRYVLRNHPDRPWLKPVEPK